MAAAFLEWSCGKGEAVTFPAYVTVSRKDLTRVDITGWTITVTVYNADGSVLFTKTATPTNALTGDYAWTVTHADTNVAAGVRPVDVWRTDSGSERELGSGTFVIIPDGRYGN